MKEHGTKPEIEIYDGGMVYNSLRYIESGVLESPCHYQFILGEPGGLIASVENLAFLRKLIPEGSTWSAVGIGDANIPILYATIAMGGHVRVGMEDCANIEPGKPANSNVELVERASKAIYLAGGQVATASEAREILHI